MAIIKLTESKLNEIISESIRQTLLNEAFKSNTLNNFFQQHGGVDRQYRQFSLGDISDEQIGYAAEFQSPNEANQELRKLKRPQQHGKRSDYDMKYLFHIFTANDGTSILIGVDRNTIQTEPYWGGEYEKKVADRLWSNGWNYKTRDNRYVDDKDTYYYQSPAKDFGVYNSQDFKKKASDNKRTLERQPENKRQQFNQDKLKHMRNYLQTHYPEKWKNKGK